MNIEKETIGALNELIGYCDNEIKEKKDIDETIDSLNELMGYGKLDNTYQKRKEIQFEKYYHNRKFIVFFNNNMSDIGCCKFPV